MSVIGSDSRQIITTFNTFPFSTVTTVDIQRNGGNFIGTGITIAPNHVLTAGHNAYNRPTNTTATGLRTTISASENALTSRIIGAAGDPAANVTNVNFLDNYNTSGNKDDDIALFTTSNAPLTAANVIGLIAFLDADDAEDLTIDTAGYPGDNVSAPITGNTGSQGRDLVRSPGATDSPGEIVDTSGDRRFFYSPDVDTFGGQSGSGVWHTLDGDTTPRVLGVHTQGAGGDDRLISIFGNRNSGVLITKDIYDGINSQIATNSGTNNGNQLPENAIIGTDPGFFSFLPGSTSGNDEIFGSYRRERIIGKGGDDTLLGGGADDRLEGDEGVDQALFSDEFVNYDFTITDPSNPAFEFVHARGTQADGTDTTKDIEFGVFEFVDGNDNDTNDDDGNLFFVPLQVDPDDNTKLKDGPKITPEQDIKDDEDNTIGTITVESPAWMFDGDVNYTLTIGSEQNILFNFAYIIDVSGSMSGTPLQQAQAAYEALTQALIDDGIADNSEFGIVPFSSSASLIGPVDATTAISTINGLSAGGGTNFGPALAEAEGFFNSRNNNATNIAYFLSDGQGDGASASLQSVAEVRAFGIGGADLSTLNIIDSDNAVLLSNPADLVTEFNAATVDRDTIDRIEVKLGGTIVETINPSQLVEDTLGLQFEGTIDGLEVSRTAENEIVFDVIFNNGNPTASLNYKITTGQEEVTTQTENGTKEVIVFSVNQSDFFSPSSSSSPVNDTVLVGTENQLNPGIVGQEIIGNDLDNTIEVTEGENTLFGNGGNDRFLVNGGVNLVDGGEGIDTAVLPLTQSEAGTISQVGNVTNIGTDTTLINTEFIEFTDVRLAVDALAVVPIISFTEQAINVDEGDDGSQDITFTLNLSSATTEDVVINYNSRPDGAEVDADFSATNGQLTIAAGSTSAEVTLTIFGDTEVEGDEAVFIDFEVVSGATFADAAVTESAGVNIIDDDSAIALTVTGDDFSIIEGNDDNPSSIFFSLDRFGDTRGTDVVEIAITPTGDNPIDADDLVNGLSTIEVTFAPNEETKDVDIPISPDESLEADETLAISLNNTSGSASVSSEDVIFTIVNDDEIALDTVFNRFRNQDTNGTYLFAGEEESVNIRDNFSPPFVEEGAAFTVAVEASDELVRFNRFQNENVPGTYLFANEEESESIRNNFPNFIEEGIAFYAYGADSGEADPFYRFQNSQQPGTYIFVSEGERQDILANFPQFVEEGIAFEAGIV